MKISTFATDLDLEENGVWVDIGQGASLLIARQGNPRYNEHVRKTCKPHSRQIRNQTISEELSNELLIASLAETILLDWKGLEDDKGKPIKYSKKAAIELLTGLKDFRALVQEIAREQATFRAAEIEEEGNV